MCIGTFGRSTTVQICVQDMKCSLMVFEAENQLFHRSINLTTALHPGPIIYTPHSDSVIVASSSAILISYRYSVLATASSGKSGKKITVCFLLIHFFFLFLEIQTCTNYTNYNFTNIS